VNGHRHEDVIVLGAGPAGCAAARLLAAWGHRVVIVTRAPRARTLAESLPPSASKLLDRVGVRSAVDGAGFIRATGNTARWGAGDVRVEPFLEGLGYQLPRDRFDALLLSEATDAGASVVWGVTGRILSGRDLDGCAAVRFDFGGYSASLRAPWVLDCTGQKRAARAPGEVAAGPRTIALAGVWESQRWALPDPTHTLVESYDGGWAWSVPSTPERRFVTVMMDPSVTPLGGKRAIEAEYRRQLARAEWIRSSISAGARMVGTPWACDATPRFSGGVASEGVLRVGDAASFVDPLSSYGIKKALASAWLAAVVVNTCLLDAALAAPATALYERRERAMYDALSRQAAALAGSAGNGHDGAFWRARLGEGDAFAAADGGDDGPRLEALGSHPRVAAAFAELKARDHIDLREGSGVAREPRPLVEGDRVVLKEHLVGATFGEGVRYLRNVDLPLLLRLAPEHQQVGPLFDAYARTAGRVPLPDFLAALSTLIAVDALVFA
jgi:flavin-dependent dehydrogenase